MKITEAEREMLRLARYGDAYSDVDIGDLRARTIALAQIVTYQGKLIRKLLRASKRGEK